MKTGNFLENAYNPLVISFSALRYIRVVIGATMHLSDAEKGIVIPLVPSIIYSGYGGADWLIRAECLLGPMQLLEPNPHPDPIWRRAGVERFIAVSISRSPAIIYR